MKRATFQNNLGIFGTLHHPQNIRSKHPCLNIKVAEILPYAHPFYFVNDRKVLYLWWRSLIPKCGNRKFEVSQGLSSN